MLGHCADHARPAGPRPARLHLANPEVHRRWGVRHPARHCRLLLATGTRHHSKERRRVVCTPGLEASARAPDARPVHYSPRAHRPQRRAWAHAEGVKSLCRRIWSRRGRCSEFGACKTFHRSQTETGCTRRGTRQSTPSIFFGVKPARAQRDARQRWISVCPRVASNRMVGRAGVMRTSAHQRGNRTVLQGRVLSRNVPRARGLFYLVASHTHSPLLMKGVESRPGRPHAITGVYPSRSTPSRPGSPWSRHVGSHSVIAGNQPEH